MRFPGIDTYNRSAKTLADSFTHVTNRWYRRAGTHLHDHDRLMLVLGQETVETHFLAAGPVGQPGIITEHQDVWSGWPVAVATFRDMPGAHCVEIYRDRFMIVPDVVTARRETLQVVNRAMDLENLVFRIT